jgi:DNA (cytosine-5)-methyltransferase 1/tRNA (cytosine38-C5)-methyltransferase
MRALELYAGIGGFAAAIEGRAQIVAAVDQSDVALSAYSANFAHATWEKNIMGLSADALARANADLWWLSPPCQSFTVRGKQLDVDDTRAKSFLKLVSVIEQVRPRCLALENVAAFAGSLAHRSLIEALQRAGYSIRERTFCPTEIGVPNRRPRYYLVASTGALGDWRAPSRGMRPLADYVDDSTDEALLVDGSIAHKYSGAMHVLEARGDSRPAQCFTSAYGRSYVRSGSFLSTDRGIRRFSPHEILALLGFPRSFRLPASIAREKAYGLIGNSLSVIAVREVLGIVPGLCS